MGWQLRIFEQRGAVVQLLCAALLACAEHAEGIGGQKEEQAVLQLKPRATRTRAFKLPCPAGGRTSGN